MVVSALNTVSAIFLKLYTNVKYHAGIIALLCITLLSIDASHGHVFHCDPSSRSQQLQQNLALKKKKKIIVLSKRQLMLAPRICLSKISGSAQGFLSTNVTHGNLWILKVC